jgi:hypothetical protein
MGLTGSQWGVMTETGSYPGQPWLWLSILWYQVPGWTNSANIDMIAIYMTGLATILLLLIPILRAGICSHRGRGRGQADLLWKNVILLAGAWLRDLSALDLGVLIRLSGNRGWHGSNFFRNGICGGIRAGSGRPAGPDA